MAQLLIIDLKVTVVLSAAEKLAAMHGNVTVPRSAITHARVAEDGMAEVQGLRCPGTNLPGLVMVGTWRNSQRTTFAVCHRRRPAIVLEVTGAGYDRIVVTVDNPEEVVSELASRTTP
jgi:hypothetical protein